MYEVIWYVKVVTRLYELHRSLKFFFGFHRTVIPSSGGAVTLNFDSGVHIRYTWYIGIIPAGLSVCCCCSVCMK